MIKIRGYYYDDIGGYYNDYIWGGTIVPLKDCLHKGQHPNASPSRSLPLRRFREGALGWGFRV